VTSDKWGKDDPTLVLAAFKDDIISLWEDEAIQGVLRRRGVCLEDTPGFFLNDKMDDFSIKPGVPNMYGAIGGEANAIMPGKRMLSSMAPTIVLKDNKPFLVVGTPGGTTIPTSVFQTLINILEFNLDTEDAVYKPKFHHQWLPDTLEIEKGFSPAIREALQKKGYAIAERSGIGRTEVIKVLADGKFEAVADNRGDDDAEGW